MKLSEDLEAEIRRRAADVEFGSLDILLREALAALDRERAFEAQLLEGLDGEEIPLTPESLDEIRKAGLARLRELEGR